MEEIEINTDVLVIGGGATGVKVANEIADSGYRVLLAEASGSVDMGSERGIEVLTNTSLVDNAGIPGDFTASLESAGKVTQYKVGAVVVATESHFEPMTEAYGLTSADSVLTQSKLEADLGANPESFAGKIVAFFTGFTQESNPIALQRILSAAVTLQEKGSTVFVYVNNLKVGADGLDRLYMAARDKGVNYFKLETLPAISQNGAELTVTSIDPVLRQEMVLAPDVIVVEEQIVPDSINSSLAEILRIQTSPQGYLQKDNVHLFPVRSNREGIYIAGSARELLNVSASLTDAENVALEAKKLLGNGKKLVAADQAVVDRGKCVICLTCYRCCPHGAIYWDDRAVISPVACQGCGICASECPMDAIQLGAYKDEDLRAAVKESVTDTGKEPNIVAFCCQNSAYEAAQMAADFNMKLPAGLRTIKVPCAGKIDIDFIMNAFVEGADGVLVMACHTGNCKSLQGNTYAGWRVADAQRKMTDAGFESDRLRFVTLASNMGSAFAAIATEMEQTLKELGPSPLK